MSLRTTLILGLALVGCLGNSKLAAADYPPPAPWKPDPAQREYLRRSLTLLSTSTPTERHTVKVLFYGQSITAQDWWKEVARYLRSTYTNANLIIENRAIGGHSSQLLVKTAEADLDAFQPDLLIFHVYGSHLDYEKIFQRLRARTCADVILQTDHITKDESLTEETDPAKLTPAQWDSWMNHSFLPATAAKYAACRADIHELWKKYLAANHLKASALLRDGVHLNQYGDWLMAELLKPYLAPLSVKAGYDPFNASGVTTPQLALTPSQKTLRLNWSGNRADVVFKPGATGSVSVLVDGKKPSLIPGSYHFTRASYFPNSDWPLLLKIGSQTPLVSEEWSAKLDNISVDGKVFHFTLRGSVTGADGEDWSTNRFVSSSGRVVIEPDDWNLAYCIAVYHRPLPENHLVTWKSVLAGADTVQPSAQPPGVENAVTVAQGLANGTHTLELQGENLAELIQSVRFYRPRDATPAHK